MRTQTLKILTITSIAIISVGCASMQKKNEELKQVYIDTVPVCSGQTDCLNKWNASQIWIVENSAFKLQTVTDVMIQTYNPVKDTDDRLGYTVIKKPAGDGKYVILIKPTCSFLLGCGSKLWLNMIAFNETVRSAHN